MLIIAMTNPSFIFHLIFKIPMINNIILCINKNMIDNISFKYKLFIIIDSILIDCIMILWID
jgi:hypothetical protein